MTSNRCNRIFLAWQCSGQVLCVFSNVSLTFFNLVLNLPYRLIVSPHSQRLRTLVFSSGTLIFDLSGFLEHLVLLSLILEAFCLQIISIRAISLCPLIPHYPRPHAYFSQFFLFSGPFQMLPHVCRRSTPLGPLVLCSFWSIVLLSSRFLILSVLLSSDFAACPLALSP